MAAAICPGPGTANRGGGERFAISALLLELGRYGDPGSPCRSAPYTAAARPPAGRRRADADVSWLCTGSRGRLTGGDIMDADILEQVLPALARGVGGQAGQRAWMALPGMTGRTCSRGRLTGGDIMDADILEQVLPALARGVGGQAGQRAWMALPGMTARIC